MDQEDNFYEIPIPIYAVGIHILLIDPDIPSLINATSVLEEATYQVTSTKLPEVALSKLQDRGNKYDLVLAAVNMKGMEFTTFLINVQMLSDIPVILISSSDEEFQVSKKSLHNGACRIMEKPITRDEARCLWQYVIRKRRVYNDVMGLGNPESVPKQLNAEAGTKENHVDVCVGKSREQVNINEEKGEQVIARPILDGVTEQNNMSNMQTSNNTSNTPNKMINGIVDNRMTSGSKEVTLRQGSGPSMQDSTMLPTATNQLQDCSKELTSHVFNSRIPNISYGHTQIPMGRGNGAASSRTGEEAILMENCPATQMTIAESHCQNVVSDALVAGQIRDQSNQHNGSGSILKGSEGFSVPVYSTLTGTAGGIVATGALTTQTSLVGSQSPNAVCNAPVAGQIPNQMNQYNGRGSRLMGSEGFSSPVYSTLTSTGRGTVATGTVATQTPIAGSQSWNAVCNAPVVGQIPDLTNHYNGHGSSITGSEGFNSPLHSTLTGRGRGTVATGTLATQTTIVGSQSPNAFCSAPVAGQIPNQPNHYSGCGSRTTGCERSSLPVYSTSTATGRGVLATGNLANQTTNIGLQSPNVVYNPPVAGQIPNQPNHYNGCGSGITGSEGSSLPVYSTSTATGRVLATGTLATQTTNAVWNGPVAGQIPNQPNHYNGCESRITGSEGSSLPVYSTSTATGRELLATGTHATQTTIVGSQFQNVVCSGPVSGQIPNQPNHYTGCGSRITGSEGSSLPVHSTSSATGRGVLATGTLASQTTIVGSQSQNAVCNAAVAGQLPSQTNQYNGCGSKITGSEGFSSPACSTLMDTGREVLAAHMPCFNSQSEPQGTNSLTMGNHVNRAVILDGRNSLSENSSAMNPSNQSRVQEPVNNYFDRFGSWPPTGLKERIDKIRQAYVAKRKSGNTDTASQQHTSHGLHAQRINESNQQDNLIDNNVSAGIASRSFSNGKRNRPQFEGLSNENAISKRQMIGGHVAALQNDVTSTNPENWGVAPSPDVCLPNSAPNASQFLSDNCNPPFVQNGDQLPPQPTGLYGNPNLPTSSSANNCLLVSNEIPIQQTGPNQDLRGTGMSSNACLPNHNVEQTDDFSGIILESLDEFNPDAFLTEPMSTSQDLNDNDVYLDDILVELGKDFIMDGDLQSLGFNPSIV